MRRQRLNFPEKERRKGMEVKRREFLKTGVATLGAASLGVMAAGVVGKKNVAEAAAEPEYKLYAFKSLSVNKYYPAVDY
jgi:hypothetical protein